jgi:hypothetical protein
VPLHSNTATALFVPDKQGGAVAQRTLERFGQARPAPTAMALQSTTSQLVTSGSSIALAWQTILIDGLGLGGFGSQAHYAFGNVVTLGSAVWFISLQLTPATTANNDQWGLELVGVLPKDDLALGSSLGIAPNALLTYPQAPPLATTILLPPVVVSGWYPKANGAPTSANCNLRLSYSGSQSGVEVTSTLIVTRQA